MKEELKVKVKKKAIDEEGGESESDYVQMSWKRSDLEEMVKEIVLAI